MTGSLHAEFLMYHHSERLLLHSLVKVISLITPPPTAIKGSDCVTMFRSTALTPPPLPPASMSHRALFPSSLAAHKHHAALGLGPPAQAKLINQAIKG